MGVQPPTYLERLSFKINQLKKPNHKFIILTSGTAYQINRELLASYPVEQRGDMHRNLLYEWSEGKQTLNGLRGIIKEQVLIYRSGRTDQIVNWIKSDIDFNIRYAIVPENVFDWLNANVEFSFLKEDQCLFLD